MFDVILPTQRALERSYNKLAAQGDRIGILYDVGDDVVLRVDGEDYALPGMSADPEASLWLLLHDWPSLDVLMIPELDAVAAFASWWFVDIGSLDRMATDAGVRLLVAIGTVSGRA